LPNGKRTFQRTFNLLGAQAVDLDNSFRRNPDLEF
jgi:hypothetical protein